tara:strand:- start:3627 stop:4274 length:648 start_codon:yes stop_codon:yes gene_type:complete
MALFDSIFGTPQRDSAIIKARNALFIANQRGNDLWNKGTSSVKAKDNAWVLNQKNYSEKVFNAKLKIQGKVLKGKEDMARRLATSSKVNEGGRSRRYGDNLGLMAASKISQLENMARKVSGPIASANINSGAIQLAHRLGRANELAGVGVAATPPITYTKDNNLLKAVKLAASVATGDFGGAFGQVANGGGNASMFQWLGDKHESGTDLFNRGGV